MATRDELRKLLAVACPWCRAAVGELCSTAGTRSPEAVGPRRSDRRPIRTLDGGCHDARWQRALGREAAVLAEVVAADRGVPRRRTEEPELVGAAVDRPW